MSMYLRSQTKLKSFRGIHINVQLLKFNPLVYAPPYKRDAITLYRVGNREVVGYGWNGEPNYADKTAFPFPSIRYKEPTQEVMALREREKGNWKLLSKEDKKALYRASFCQTFSEFTLAEPKEFFMHIGVAFILVSVGLWISIGIQKYVQPELPDSFIPEHKKAQLRRMILLQVNPIFGLTSNWDYEKMDWKKKGWFTPANPFAGCDNEMNLDLE